ncbi:vesicle transport protein GOT1A [Silurus meridionalis]|nr:vesicle transport protein GOT1A [Silurus meridionalis]
MVVISEFQSFGIFFLLFGVLLYFDSVLLAFGNILFLTGLAFITGLRRTAHFFFQRHKLRASSFFLGGVALVVFRWPRIGMLVETYGFVLLFKSFFPMAFGFLGTVLNMPFLTAHEDKKDSVNDSNHQQYMTTIQTADYENIPEGKLPSALEIKNKMAKKNRDYVNIEEQHNMPLTKGRISKTKRHQIDQDESQTSSESSSDESDEVNYTTVVFKKVTNEELKEN